MAAVLVPNNLCREEMWVLVGAMQDSWSLPSLLTLSMFSLRWLVPWGDSFWLGHCLQEPVEVT